MEDGDFVVDTFNSEDEGSNGVEDKMDGRSLNLSHLCIVTTVLSSLLFLKL